MLDELLELRIFRGIIVNHFTNEGIQVAIGNNSGNNLEMIVFKEEQNKVLDLEKTVEELRLFKKETSQINNVVSTVSFPKSRTV